MAADIDRGHRRYRDWHKIGYHYFHRLDGKVEKGSRRGRDRRGLFGLNARSIHICYAGWPDETGNPADIRSAEQLAPPVQIVRDLKRRDPNADVILDPIFSLL